MLRRICVALAVALAASIGIAAPAAASSDDATVTGRIVNSSGVPIVGAKLVLIQAIGVLDHDTTDESGTFSLATDGVTGAMSMSLGITIGSREQFVPVTMRGGRTNSLAPLRFSAGSSIRGAIAGVSKTAATWVSLINRAGEEVVSESLPAGTRSFRFSWAVPGHYTVRAQSGTSAAWVYWGSTRRFENAHFIRVAAGTTKNVSLSLTKNTTGSLSGVVRAVGTPAPGATAMLMLVRVKGSDLDVVPTPATSASFAMKSLAPGTYRVTKFTVLAQDAVSLASRKTSVGTSRFVVSPGHKTVLGTFRLPASYFLESWGE